MTLLQRRLLLVLLIASGILNYADRQIIALLKPIMEAEFSWTDRDYGQLTSVFQFAAAVALLYAGRFVDRVGVIWANPLAVGAWSLAAMGHAAARTLSEFTVMRVALGAAEAVNTPAVIKTVTLYYDQKSRSVALGFMMAASSIGAIIAPLIVPRLALAYGWQASFLILGGLGLVWVAAWIAMMRGQRGPVRSRQADAVALVPWRIVLSDRRTWAVAGSKAISDHVWWFLLFWAPDLFHRQYHLDLVQIGDAVATIYVGAATGSVVGGFVSGRLVSSRLGLNRARKLALLTCGLLITPLALVPYLDDYRVVVVVLTITLAAHQVFAVNVFGIIADIIPSTSVGTVTSLGALAGNLSGMTVLAITGALLSAGGSYKPLFLVASVSYLLSLAWIHLLLPVLQPAQADGHDS